MTGVQEFGDWDEFTKKVDPRRFRRQLRKEVKQANAYIGSYFVAASKKSIQAGEYAKNSPMTIAMKGSSKPLVNDGDLLGAITWAEDLTDPLAAWVGLNRTANEANIGAILHEGATLRVTRKMRAAVFAKLSELAKGTGEKARLAREFLSRWQRPAGTGKFSGKGKEKQRKFFFAKKNGKKFWSAPAKKTVWVIPPRPYITGVITAPEFQRLAVKKWMEALSKALHTSSEVAA